MLPDVRVRVECCDWVFKRFAADEVLEKKLSRGEIDALVTFLVPEILRSMPPALIRDLCNISSETEFDKLYLFLIFHDWSKSKLDHFIFIVFATAEIPALFLVPSDCS